METFAEIGIGIELNSLTLNEGHPFETAFDVAQAATTTRFSIPTWIWKLQRLLGLGIEGQLQDAVKTIDASVMGFISESMESRARGEKRTGGAHNIVSLILDSSDLEGEVDPQLLRSMVVAAIIAGRETSAQTLSWFIYMLSENPTWSKKFELKCWGRSRYRWSNDI